MWYVDALFNTASVGGALACIVIVSLIICYGFTIRWISGGHEKKTERD
jgi:hypothetical protein